MSASTAIQLSFKLPLKAGTSVELTKVIPEFHRWIREDLLPDLLVDVTNYAHVKNGPGVLLIAHEAQYSLDETHGEQGLLFIRKRGEFDSPTESIRQALASTLRAAHLLEETLGLEFDLNRIQFKVNNRRLAPNTEATFTELSPYLSEALSELWGEQVELSYQAGSKELFTVVVESQNAPTIATLLGEFASDPIPVKPIALYQEADGDNLLQVGKKAAG